MAAWPNLILVATDFSAGSDEALDKAIELARQTEADLEILHVLELGAETFPYGLAYFEDRAALLAHLERELAQRAARATEVGVVTCTTKLLEGGGAVEIVQRARKVRADLVVVGTHGRKGLAHVLLGSVAERVVHHAGCPVLTVPFSGRGVEV